MLKNSPEKRGRHGMAYCILSCDGGGIRGLLPALIIQRLSTDIPAFLNQVNLFAGTSAGAFVALGLASQISVDQIVNLFEKGGPQIFQPYSSSTPVDAARLVAAREALSSAGSGDSWW